MGTPVTEIPIGLECGHWDPPAETPVAMYIFFWDVEKGDKVGARQPPNGHVFRLEQDALSPCDYDHDSPLTGWLVEFNIQAALISVNLRDQADPNKIYFLAHLHHSPPVEYDVFTNDYQTPVNNYGYAGYCMVFWMTDIIAMAEDFGLLWPGDLMLEIFGADAPFVIIKFCTLTLRVNVRVKKNVTI